MSKPLSKTIASLKDKLLDVKYNRIEMGKGLGISEIDEYLVFKHGSFNICTGHANTGKTTVILYMMLAYAEKHGIKWLIYSSENTDYSIARKLVEFRTGKTIQQLSESQLDAASDWISQHFMLVNNEKLQTAYSLMEDVKEIYKDWKFDGLLIDPYNSLAIDSGKMRGKSEHQYHYEVASELRLLCKELNVSMWLNTHAVTAALRNVYDKDHEYAGHPRPPKMSDIEGGGKWGNRADDVITIHRMTQHPTLWNTSEIHITKVKEVETGGKPTPQDSPIALRMEAGNVGFSCNGLNVMSIIQRQKLPKEEAKLKPISPAEAFDINTKLF